MRSSVSGLNPDGPFAVLPRRADERLDYHLSVELLVKKYRYVSAAAAV
jgi:hypothetical protein